jgi:hypothetical protein
MKTPSKELQVLFIELLTAELSSFKRVSLILSTSQTKPINYEPTTIKA